MGDIFPIFFYTCFGSVSTIIISTLCWSVIRFFLYTYEYKTYYITKMINKLVISHAWYSPKEFDGENYIPSDGFHFAWLSGPIIFKKDAKSQYGSDGCCYKVYLFNKKSLRYLQFKPIYTDNSIQITFLDSIHSSNPSRLTTEVYLPCPNCSNEQSKVVNDIFSKYENGMNTIVTMITGIPGTGKSTTSEYVYMKFKQNGYTPKLIRNFHPADRGMSIYITIDHIIKLDSPVIMEISEYDIAVEKSLLSEDSSRDTKAHAQNKASFATFHDFISRKPGLIVICTSNKSLDQMKKMHNTDKSITGEAFIRPGRFHLFYEFKEKINCL